MDIATQEWKVPNAKSKFTHIIAHSCLSVNFMAGSKYVSDQFVPVMSARAGKIYISCMMSLKLGFISHNT